MGFFRRLFEPRAPKAGDIIVSTTRIIRWSEQLEGLSIEECARKGIEALAGLVIDGDEFGATQVEGTMTVFAEFYYTEGGPDSDDGDMIGVYLRRVDWLNDDYPKVGEEREKMLLQAVSDGSCFARWNQIDRSRADESIHGIGMMMVDDNMREVRRMPKPLGEIPPQADNDSTLPSFLLIHNSSIEWQIWRRYAPPLDQGAEFRGEQYVQVFPAYLPDETRHFRTYLDDGRIEGWRGG